MKDDPPNRALNENLRTARSTGDILSALATKEWRRGECYADPEIPTERDLARWMPNCPPDTIRTANQQLAALVGNSHAQWGQCEAGMVLPMCGPSGDPPQDMALVVLIPATATVDTVPFAFHAPEVIETEVRFEEDRQPPIDRTATVILGHAVEAVHCMWKAGPHPLAPLVAAWQIRSREVESNGRPDPIFPAPMIMVRRDDARAGGIFARAARVAQLGDETQYLPGFQPAPGEGPLGPALPLAIYDLGGKPEVAKRGAPLPLRIFVEVVISVPQHERDPNRVVLLPPERVRDWLLRLYPRGPKHYRPSRDWPRIKDAVDALNSWDARIPWEKGDGSGALRQVVIPADVPRSGRANDWIRFGVHLPPGSERGALVDRPALRLAGVRSGPAYRLALSLSFEWHRPGWRRQPLKRAGKTTSWRQVREPGRYPVLTDDRLLAGAYPTGMPVRRNAVQRARIALQYLVRIGLVELFQDAGLIRALPGPQWAGWQT